MCSLHDPGSSPSCRSYSNLLVCLVKAQFVLRFCTPDIIYHHDISSWNIMISSWYHHDIIYHGTPFLLVSSADSEPYLFQVHWWKLLWFSAATSGCSIEILSIWIIWDVTEGDERIFLIKTSWNWIATACLSTTCSRTPAKSEWKQCHKLDAFPPRCQKASSSSTSNMAR